MRFQLALVALLPIVFSAPAGKRRADVYDSNVVTKAAPAAVQPRACNDDGEDLSIVCYQSYNADKIVENEK
ncbi:hypothetical protein BDV95DRAFT_605418 [Massariosphaeria phaeospora]|uniref:Uncharacterized protein n=1 Tax=Massariosphaeria phaeospora TaxID=100035 RepID=A0A7C8MQY2_9PLEO|nr:hypothetical protein BDV95DRAFT_605418 [Massariosphaeria phaeospora]